MINCQNWRQEDPFRAREIAKYGATALPSREFILSWLEEVGKLVTFTQIITAFGLDEAESALLSYRLKAMLSAGQVMKNRNGRFGLVKKMNLVRGKVIAHQEGYGFFVADEKGLPDSYITPHDMAGLMHGDTILARLEAPDARGRSLCVPVEILQRGQKRVVGTIKVKNDLFYLVPENRRLPQPLIIPPNARAGAKDGQIVIGEIEQYPTRAELCTARVVAILGEALAPGLEVDIAIETFQIPHVFPPEVMEEVARLPDEVAPADWQTRLDLRHLPFVTIDGIDSRDFDDAVYAEQRGENYRLYVAIADVAHYVRAGCALDSEAYERGTSVYFPDRVIPMLPEKLSTGLCSLNPQVDRLALVCEMTISPTGQVKRSAFHEAVIHSHARLTYQTVENILFGDDVAMRESFTTLLRPLENLRAVYEILRAQREARGVIDFASPEPAFEYDSEGKICAITARPRLKAYQLIEECMVIANVCAAKFVSRHKMPALYRVHAKPDLTKLRPWVHFLAQRGITWRGSLSYPSPQQYAAVLQQCANRPDYAEIEMMALRSMMQALYSPHNEGHFGLALNNYAHFTSPIRRYPDLLVHRAVKAVLHGETLPADNLEAVAAHCSETERRADSASLDAMDFLKCEFMSHRVGEVFAGKISHVVSFGFFVTLDDLFVDGLVHISNLKNDYYHYDDSNATLTGEMSGQVFAPMDAVMVKVAKVDVADRKIDFELLNNQQKKTTKTRNSRAASKRKKNARRK